MITKQPARFLKLHPDAVIPEYKTKDSACCDITVIEDVELYPSETKLARTGLVCVPPEGFHWQVYLRSSAPLKFPGLILANSVGIIDSDYCGPEDELKLILGNTRETPSVDLLGSFPSAAIISIKAGTRIAQIRLVENIRPQFIEEVTYERLRLCQNRGGFGSTGSTNE